MVLLTSNFLVSVKKNVFLVKKIGFSRFVLFWLTNLDGFGLVLVENVFGLVKIFFWVLDSIWKNNFWFCLALLVDLRARWHSW